MKKRERWLQLFATGHLLLFYYTQLQEGDALHYSMLLSFLTLWCHVSRLSSSHLHREVGYDIFVWKLILRDLTGFVWQWVHFRHLNILIEVSFGKENVGESA